MDLQPDSWVTETQSTLKDVTTASLKGQHSRIRRAKARESWYNTGVSNDGHLIKPFRFVDQQELISQNNSKLLSSIRSHVKQNTYMKRKATNAGLEEKRKNSHHPLILPRPDRSRKSPVQIKAKCLTPVDKSGFDTREHALQHLLSYPSSSVQKAAPLSALSYVVLFKNFVGYNPFDRPRALFLLSHYRDTAKEAWYPEAVDSVIEWTRSNVILLHVILYCAACHFRMVTNSSDYSDIYHYRGKAIKITSDVLDDPAARVSNETLGGLCHLVMAEEMYGSRAAAAVHRKGLQRLFELRRAIPGTSMNSIARHLLPLTNLRLPSKNMDELNPISCPATSISGQETTNLEVFGRKDPILEVFNWLKDTPLELPLDLLAAETGSCLVRVKLEYKIISQNHHGGSPRRCWLVAALVYLHTIIATQDGWHLLPKFEAHLINDLRQLMEQIREDPLSIGFDTGVHVWILIFGGVHARGEDAAWYQGAVKELCKMEGFSKWDDIKVLTQDLPWVHKEVERCLEDFFKSCIVGDKEDSTDVV